MDSTNPTNLQTLQLSALEECKNSKLCSSPSLLSTASANPLRPKKRNYQCSAAFQVFEGRVFEEADVILFDGAVQRDQGVEFRFVRLPLHSLSISD